MARHLIRRLKTLLRLEAWFEVRSASGMDIVTWANCPSYDAAKSWIMQKHFAWAAKGGTMYIAKVSQTGEVQRLGFE